MKETNCQTTSYILLSYKGGDELFECLRSIQKQAGNKEIIVVDNGSANDITYRLVIRKNINLIKLNSNSGVAGGWNIGAKLASGNIYIFITQDVVIDANFQKEIEETFLNDNTIGVTGALLLYPKRRKIQHAGGMLVYPRYTTRHISYKEPYKKKDFPSRLISDHDYVTGAVLACKSEVFWALNGFDAQYFPAYYEDVDFCYRAKEKGWRVVINSKATGCHRESITFGYKSKRFLEIYTKNRYYFIIKNLNQLNIVNIFVDSEINWILQLPSKQQTRFFHLLTNEILPSMVSVYTNKSDNLKTQFVKMFIMRIVNQARRGKR